MEVVVLVVVAVVLVVVMVWECRRLLRPVVVVGDLVVAKIEVACGANSLRQLAPLMNGLVGLETSLCVARRYLGSHEQGKHTQGDPRRDANKTHRRRQQPKLKSMHV